MQEKSEFNCFNFSQTVWRKGLGENSKIRWQSFRPVQFI